MLRWLFFQLVVRPVILIALGLNVRHRERLPSAGPAIVVANHNSHLDTMVLMTLFPSRLLSRLRPVAAADYFLRNRWMAWFSLKIIGIVPVDRSGGTPKEALFDGATAALKLGQILILFPEGSRGDPETLDRFKTGIAHIAKKNPEIDVVPVFMHGFGKALPRGEAVLVPFFCDVFVGEAFRWTGDRESFMQELIERMQALAEEGHFPEW